MAEKIENEKTGKSRENFTQNLSDFIQRNRGSFLVGSIVIVVLLVGFIAVTSIKGSLDKKSLIYVEDFVQRYEDLQAKISENKAKSTENADGNKESGEETGGGIEAEIDNFLNEVTVFASKHKGYAGSRAYSIVANIYSEKENWIEVKKAWDSAALLSKGTYFEPVSFYNAAVAAEEQGNIQEAIALYTKAAAAPNFSACSRAQFAIGRLEESQNNKDAAVEMYRDLLNKWPDDQVWSNLAQSRIIFLNSRK
jgi:tetratricopeptide (TPR) repeat protein